MWWFFFPLVSQRGKSSIQRERSIGLFSKEAITRLGWQRCHPSIQNTELASKWWRWHRNFHQNICCSLLAGVCVCNQKSKIWQQFAELCLEEERLTNSLKAVTFIPEYPQKIWPSRCSSPWLARESLVVQGGGTSGRPGRESESPRSGLMERRDRWSWQRPTQVLLILSSGVRSPPLYQRNYLKCLLFHHPGCQRNSVLLIYTHLLTLLVHTSTVTGSVC